MSISRDFWLWCCALVQVSSYKVFYLTKSSLSLQSDAARSTIALVKYRTSVGFKAKCEKYKEMRAARTLLHRTSKKSFARLEEELKEQSENPEVITRSVVWVHAYETKKKKGSDKVVEDHEIMKQVKQCQAKEQPSQPCSLKDDVVAKVLGPDPRGRGSISVQYSANKVAQQKENVNQSVTQSKQNNPSVQRSEIRSPKSKQSNQRKTSRLQHSTDHRMQSKDKEGTRAKGIKDVQNRIELLSWFEMSKGVVAIAKLDSKDPNAMVHHVPLGPEC